MSWHPNNLLLSRHLGGQCGAVTRWRVRRHLASCGRCRRDWDELARERAAYDQSPDRQAELLALAARIPRAVPTPATTRSPWFYLAPVAAILAAALGAVLILGGPEEETFRARGTDVFAVYLKHGAAALPLPETCRPGDRLRARYKSHRAFVFIVGVDASGTVSPLVPAGGTRSIPAPPQERTTEGSWVLDDTLGTERFIALFSDTPLMLDEVADALTDRPERGPQDAQTLVIIEHRCQKVSP